MKQGVKSILNGKLLSPLRKAIFQGEALILMLHRIAPKDDSKISANENMKVSPEFLETFITTMKEDGWNFISLDSLVDGLENGNLKKSIVITIDDGYKDNFTYAFPIFLKLKIPFCIYLCASFLDKTADMWWFGLEDYLLGRDKIIFNNNHLDIQTKDKKDKAFLEIRDYLIAGITDYKSAREVMEKSGIIYNPKAYHSLALDYLDIKAMLDGGGGITNIRSSHLLSSDI